MINLSEKAGQFMAEEISEAKVNELAYKNACNQMSITESGINSLKSILKNFPSCVDPFIKFIKDFNESIKKIYRNTPFSSYIEVIIKSQEEIMNEFDTLNKEMAKLYSKTSAWNLIFQEAKEQKKIREEKKKKFEHYEQKLHKIDLKKKKNDELISRNEQKYKTAASEYVEISDSSQDMIKNSLLLSWNLVSPIISDFILIKKKAFNNIVFILNEFSDIQQKFEEIKPVKIETKDKNKNKIIINKKVNANNNTKNLNKNNSLRQSRKSAISLSVYMKFKGNKDNISKANENNITYGRLTNSFGKIPLDRYQLFYQIEDEPY